jgi:hypothetical protein
VQDAAVTTHPLLEPVRAGPLVRVVRVVVHVVRGI